MTTQLQEPGPLDHFFLAFKLRTYKELREGHIETVLRLVHVILKSIISESESALIQDENDREVRLFLINWLRANYFHLAACRIHRHPSRNRLGSREIFGLPKVPATAILTMKHGKTGQSRF